MRCDRALQEALMHQLNQKLLSWQVFSTNPVLLPNLREGSLNTLVTQGTPTMLPLHFSMSLCNTVTALMVGLPGTGRRQEARHLPPNTAVGAGDDHGAPL